MPFVQEIIQKASGALRNVQGSQKVGKSETKINGGSIHSVSNSLQNLRPAETPHHTKVKISRVFNITFQNTFSCFWMKQIRDYVSWFFSCKYCAP